MAKRITSNQKEEITKLFISGISIENISKKFNFTKLTITRNLKNNLGDVAYKEFLAAIKSNNKLIKNKKQEIKDSNKNDIKNNIKPNNNNIKEIPNKDIVEEFPKTSEFIEITPLNFDIENTIQKDFSSLHISEINFPSTVFMIVDKKVELEIRYLRDYPKWHFLSEKELERKTIEIYYELKIAKSFCSKEQKVIKVPNTDVFKLVAPILRSRGISRIISSDKLIAL